MYNNLARLLATQYGTCNPIYLFGNNSANMQIFIEAYISQIDKNLIKIKTYYDFLKDIKKWGSNLVKSYFKEAEILILGGICVPLDKDAEIIIGRLIGNCIRNKKQIILVSTKRFEAFKKQSKNSIILNFDV